MKAIIDTDPGTDDALAIAMALDSPALDVLGMTTVGGNATVTHTTRNALDIALWMGQPHLPVSRGAERPVDGRFPYAYHYHGRGGLTARLEPSDAPLVPLGAPDYLAYQAFTHRGELNIIALGPLTNVARAIRREPRITEWVNHLYVMGGAVEVAGNVTPHAEFNIYSDPVAANEVLASGMDITLIGLDVCGEPTLSPADVADTDGADSPAARLAGLIVRGWFAMRPDDGRYMLCDPLTVLAAVRPDLFGYEQASVSVATGGEEAGRTIASYGEGNVRVARSVKAQEATVQVKAMLTLQPPTNN